MMTRDQKITLLADLQARIADSREMMHRVYAVFGQNPEGPFQESTYRLHDFAINAVAMLIGDKTEDGWGWLEWFIYENEWGENAHSAGYDGKMREIRTFEDLLDLIDEESKR